MTVIVLRTARNRSRAAFTLLEVLLSTAIALMLLGALYSTLNAILRQIQDGREVLDESTVARTLIHKFNTDFAGVLTPVAVVTSTAPSATPATGEASSTASTGASASTSGTMTSAGTTSGTSTATASTAAAETTSVTIVPFQAGAMGDGTNLTLFLCRVPTPPQADNNGLSSDDTPTPADIRRVSWWLTGSGGIARQERQWLLSDDISGQTEPDTSTEIDDIIAPEATDLLFEYWDGSTWQSSWDGSTLGSDMKTPIGPPMAIRVSIWIKQPDSLARGTEGQTKKFTHVIALQTAPGAASTTATGTTSTGSP